MFTYYYTLAKPGIIYGNALTVLGGFFLASKGAPDLLLCAMTVIGISFIIASGCVFNNYIDQDIDRKMERTRSRVLVRGLVAPRDAIIYGAVLGLVGIVTLYVFTNALTLLTALFGLFFYAVVYSLWSKRYSLHSTLIGSIAGAVPPVVGYVAVMNAIDLGAVILFVTISLWQMPHTFAIAIRRFDDYKNAHIPILPVVKGFFVTKLHTVLYIAAFTISAASLTFFGYTGYLYLAVMMGLSAAWFVMALTGFWVENQHAWAKRLFGLSIVVMAVFSLMIAIDPVVPAQLRLESITAWV